MITPRLLNRQVTQPIFEVENFVRLANDAINIQMYIGRKSVPRPFALHNHVSSRENDQTISQGNNNCTSRVFYRVND